MVEPDDIELETLRRRLAPVARLLDEDDRARVPPPVWLWAAIERALGPAPIVRQERRGSRARWGGLAAAAAVLAVVGVAILFRAVGDDRQVLASAAMTNEGLDERGADTTGSAAVVRVEKRVELDLRVERPPTPDGSYLEVWLIDRKVERMVSLGPYSGNGTYAIPDGIDPGRFPIVDVSLEPADGVPTHSSVSIVRGVLS